MSTALVQKCACGGTTLPFHSKTRVRMCLIFMDVSSSEELMAGPLAKRCGRIGYMTGGRRRGPEQLQQRRADQTHHRQRQRSGLWRTHKALGERLEIGRDEPTQVAD